MEVRNSDGRIFDPEPPKTTSPRDALISHMSGRPGGMTAQDWEDLDRDFPVSTEREPSPFGHIGGGFTERSTTDPLIPSDHADWLARKAEILKAAYPNDPKYRTNS